MFWVISVYFNIRNSLPKTGTFLLGHPIYNIYIFIFNFNFYIMPDNGQVGPKHVANGYTINIKLCLVTVYQLISGQ